MSDEKRPNPFYEVFSDTKQEEGSAYGISVFRREGEHPKRGRYFLSFWAALPSGFKANRPQVVCKPSTAPEVKPSKAVFMALLDSAYAFMAEDSAKLMLEDAEQREEKDLTIAAKYGPRKRKKGSHA